MPLPPSIRLVCSVVLLTLAIPVPAFAQENVVRAVLEKEGGRTTVVGSFRRGATTYVSLNDLIQIARLNSYENRETRKLEIKHPGTRVKVTAGNPFLVVTHQGGQSVLQLPRDVVFAAGSFFLPLESAAVSLELLLNMPVAYEPETRSLRIGATPAVPFDVPVVTLETKTNGMLIRVSAARRLTDVESWLRQDNWLYVTIPEVHADTATINAVRPAGIVRQIVAVQTPTAVQLTFRLEGKIAIADLLRDDSSNDLLIAIRKEGTETSVPTPEPPAIEAKPDSTPRSVSKPLTEEKSPAVKKETIPPPSAPGREVRPEPKQRDILDDLASQRERWNLDVIVIDAGHGGKDPGTIGVTGTREKDITLGISLKLGHLIERNLKGVKVVYTRKDDRFVALYRRGQIANEANGKLFISVHANSLRRKPSPTRGFEVYLLGPGRTAEAIAIAERENSVIELEEGYEERYRELTEENFILVTMARSAHVKASEQFADLVQKELDSNTPIRNRGVKQAGYVVLVGPSMPNVLIETAFISNREDEKLIRTESGQMKVADAIFRAVKRYREEYQKVLEEGNNLGER
jgi:N-acetylmuramoyl-L-alanine amidase